MSVDRDANGFPVLMEASHVALPLKPRTTDPARDRSAPAQKSVPTGAAADYHELSRRHDAVREAAREFEPFNEQDVKEWLKGKTNRVLSDAEVASFAADVRKQQLTDLIDVLDQNERGALRGRRHVKVRAPRGYILKTLKSLTDDELRSVASRLKAKGWDAKALKGLQGKMPEDRQGVFDNLSDNDSGIDIYDLEFVVSVEDKASPAFEHLAQMMKSIPVPVVNVQPPNITIEPQIIVQAPEPRPLLIKRDDKGLLSSVEPQ